MKESALFVVNPIAGGTDKTALVARLKKHPVWHRYHSHLFWTTGNDDAQRLASAIEKHRPQLAVAVGGDGTLGLMARLLAHSGILLGVVPAGSANGMARELGIPQDVDKALDLLALGNSQPLDALEIDGRHLGIHIGDIGFNARVVKHFEANKRRGKLGYAVQFFKEFQAPKRWKVVIEHDGQRIERETYMVAFANASMYGTGAVINPLGKLSDGLIEICILKEVSIMGMLDLLFSSGGAAPQTVEVIQCRQASVRAEEAFPLQLDGEPLGEQYEVTVRVAPGCLRIAVP